MPDEYWENLKEIFHAALALSPQERATYLDQACNGSLSLRATVESLLKSHEETANFVDTPAYQAAAEMFLEGMEIRSGQTVAHYRILSLLGEGGMGKVYLAEDTKLQRRVSLKFLSTNFTQDHERLRRFEQEARATSALNHPNILTIHEISEFDGLRFIATEFIEGQTLRERLRSGLDIDDALDIAIQMTSAAVAAHRVNIVHPDNKPENVMIRRDDGLVKVLDFGLAKVTQPIPSGANSESATQLITNTSPGVVMGTVAYMSPEQARGNNVDERTDIWSLGVVLYEMVAGCSPFIAATSNEIIAAILSKEPLPPLARYRDLVPERLQEIVEKAATKNRDERYQTSKDLLIDLKQLKQSLELKASIERTSSSEGIINEQSKTVPGALSTNSGELNNLTAGAVQKHFGADYIVNQVKRHRRGVAATLAALSLLCVIGTLIYGWLLKHPTASAQPRIKSLAVLPLKSFDTGENYLGLGIADAIIRRTSQAGELSVRPTSAVLKYLKENTDSLEAARQLNADAVLEGSTQRTGDRLRVSVNLLRASDGASLWTASFDMPSTDIFAVEDKVAEQVATRLALHLDSTQQAALKSRYPTEPIAYEFYLKGIFNLDERGYGEDGKPQMEITIDFFKKAIEADPNYALAHAQLAFAYVWTALFIEPADPKWADLARAEIKRSQELGPQLAETHVAHALLLWSAYEGYQNEGAIRELLIAKELNPNLSGADLPAIYGHIGLEDLASRELQRALEIDPTSQSLKDLTGILPYLRADPDGWFVVHQKIGSGFAHVSPWYYLRKHMLDDAQKSIDERLPKGSAYPDFLMQQALLFALKGNFREAETRVPGILGRIQFNDQSRHHSTYDAACIYALGGKSEEAVKWLKETAATGFPNYPVFERDPYLDRIRQAPEFIQFMADSKTRWEAYKKEFD
jgi:serine/threonine protein kinase/TolB-like protein